jgi:anthranilate phosphoribosyltransferase
VSAAQIERFATYVAALGRGPGRSRALTRAEAADAMAMLLDGHADPMQAGAFLMLLRYRGEDGGEVAGLVEAVRARLPPSPDAALDWPSYGAGRSRRAPWFLLAALALGQAGFPVLMHGTNEFSTGTSVRAALSALGLAPVSGSAQAALALAERHFAYWPIEDLCPPFAALLDLRRLFGLRSPMNTVARLLNPANALAGVDGVFHPPYIETHLATAQALGRPRLLVLKGGGGEAERNPAKPVDIHVWDETEGRSISTLPALATAPPPEAEPPVNAVWDGTARNPAIVARVVGTIALGLAALQQGGDHEAEIVWQARRPII